MNFFKYIGVLVLLLAGCEARIQPVVEQKAKPVAAPAHESKAHQPKQGKYAKPGADVRLANPAPLILEPGKMEEIDLELVTANEQGVMRVQISADPELDLFPQPGQVEFHLTPAGKYVIPLQLVAPTPGRFYVRLQVSMERDGQHQGRNLALAVQVGTPAIPLKKMAPSSSEVGEETISLPAQEIISTP